MALEGKRWLVGNDGGGMVCQRGKSGWWLAEKRGINFWGGGGGAGSSRSGRKRWGHKNSLIEEGSIRNFSFKLNLTVKHKIYEGENSFIL